MSIIRKASIQEQLDNARSDEHQRTELLWKERMNNEIERIRGKYDLREMELKSEIASLERVIEENDKVVKEANEKLKKAERLVLVAHQEIARCDFAVKRHANQAALVFTEITDVKHRMSEFVRDQLQLEEK